MLTKTASAIALVLAVASAADASATTAVFTPNQNLYNPMGAHIATLGDTGARFELDRDGHTGRN